MQKDPCQLKKIMEWRVEEIPELRGYTIEWAEDRDYILSKRNRLFRSTSLQKPFEPLAVIDAPSWKAVVGKVRLAQRLLRFLVTNVVKLNNGEIFVTFDKSVGTIRDRQCRIIPGLARPCRVLRSACAVDRTGDVYFGEYLTNDERGEMRVYRYRAGDDRLEVVYTFPRNSIRHIHGIYFDEFTDSLICLTGDDDPECRIMRTFDGFQTVEVIGEGDESWRAVSVLFTNDKFYYGTDAEFRSNRIYAVDRSSFDREAISEVSGTVFYSKRIGDDLFFSTTAENAPSQKENVAALWHVASSGKCRELARFPKDRWNGTLFMFGTIHFPYTCKADNALYFSLVGVREDNRTYRVRPS